jgi:hypothetical protein
VEASCPTGWSVLGGGGRVASPWGDEYDKYTDLNSSHPTGTGWPVVGSIDNEDGDGVQYFKVVAYAICARV